MRLCTVSVTHTPDRLATAADVTPPPPPLPTLPQETIGLVANLEAVVVVMVELSREMRSEVEQTWSRFES